MRVRSLHETLGMRFSALSLSFAAVCLLRSAALTCAAAAGVPQVLRIGGLFPIFKTEETTPKFDSDGSGPERQAGFLMAVRELNNRTAIPEQDWNSAGHHGKDAALKRWLRDHGVAIKVLVLCCVVSSLFCHRPYDQLFTYCTH